MQKTITLFIFIISMFMQLSYAQEDNEPKIYKLKDLEVTGNSRFSKSQIMRFTGLFIGKDINIPGNEINNAIKKLWRTENFTDVAFYTTNIVGDEITLSVNLVSASDLSKTKFEGISKAKAKKFEKDYKITAGTKITKDSKNKIKNNIQNYYKDKGFADASVGIKELETSDPYIKDLEINVDKGKKIKIDKVIINGNKEVRTSKIKKKMKKTKKKFLGRFWKGSKLTDDNYEADLTNITDYYKSEGFRDIKINSEKVTRNANGNYEVSIDLTEGKRYYLGDVTFVGNSKIETEELKKIFGYQTNDAYDAIGINLKIQGSDKDDDLSTLYLDQGYLFSNITPIEKSVEDDKINLEIRIVEGEQARWNKVTFDGNTTTHDHVIQRSLRTKPGDLFSKSQIKRTYFELAGMQFFEPSEITQDVVPNPENNTVDIHWGLSEKGSSQIELQGGYGGGRFIGTLGLTFNNFSLKKLLSGKWKDIIPQGDGQQLSLRAQAGANFQSYSFSFVEPWLKGVKPTALSVSFYYTLLRNNGFNGAAANLDIIGASIGLNKQLTFPDDYFRFSHGFSYKVYNFTNYPFNVGGLTLENGSSNNFNYFASIGRYSAGPNPIFQTSGSEFEVGLKITPPYSLFNNKDYGSLSAEETYKWLEYFKVKTRAYWYKEIIGKFVLKAGGEFGFLKGFNSDVGIPPFERFYVGGTGLNGNNFDGREIIPLRGYEDATNIGGQSGRDITPLGGGTIYNKYLLELRYPITVGQAATIYGLGFFEAGNTWNEFGTFKPFDVKRAAGIGIRIFMPQFGLIGFDYAYGFDNPLNSNVNPGWQTHFIIGQQF